MTSEIVEIMQQHAELVCDCNLPDSVVVEIVKAAELKRIADTLEDIGNTLDSINQSLDMISDVLEECQVKNRYGSAISVTGTIQQI